VGKNKKHKKEKNKKKDSLNFKKVYQFVKENLGMIILIPTLVGGIWEVFSLWSLGFEYIRFFSITQLVSDGLLMMILLPLTSIFPIIGFYIVRSFREKNNKKKNKTPLIKHLFICCYFCVFSCFQIITISNM
jgi:hypothetical protein